VDGGDADLLSRCRAGDDAAWDQLVGKYERLVFSVALRNGLDREDAADVTQTTFIALLDSIDRVRQEERLASWLMAVARRQAWQVRNRQAHGELPDELPTVGSGDPITDWERFAVVHEALQQTPEPCRALLIGLYFDPAAPTYAELARRLGRAIGGIGPMRARCLERLRDLIGEDLQQ
jgi:RNA polymerase sigma factor (sigma-70 family)